MTDIKSPSGPSGKQADTKDEIKDIRHHDILAGQLYAGNEKKTSSLEMEIFQGNRCPLQGVDLGDIGMPYDFQFTVNPNPFEGFSIKVTDGKDSANELVQYQILKGGYNGKAKLLVEYNRPFAPALDDPYITITMFQKEMAIDKICGPIPDGIKPGTLMEWRENGWREEAKKILRNINGYNPKTQEVLKITRKFVSTDITELPEGTQYTLHDEDQRIFKEDELIDVVKTDVKTLPKIRYMENFYRCLGEIKTQLGYK